MRLGIAVDSRMCMACYCCFMACKDEHCDNDWMPYTRPQPETGHFWMKVVEKVRGNVPVVKLSYTPLFCAHCAEAPCMAAASNDAVYRRDDGLVIIDPEKSVGQKAIAEACPIGAIYWNDTYDIPQKCTGCAHLLDDEWKEPRCVDACPTEALRFGDEEDFAAEIAQAELLAGTDTCGPRVYYLNLPKRFVAGCMVDRTINEVLIGADVLLFNSAGEEVATTSTDDFGDWKFDQIEPDVYKIRLTMEGYEPAELEANVTEKDLSLGDFFAHPSPRGA